MLFPIAFFSFFIFWVTERYQLAYTYQLPPAMDDKMTANAVTLMSLSPIIFLINGYWMLSNKQMFENVINSKHSSEEEMPSGHDLGSLAEMSQATPMLLISITLIVIHLGRSYFYEQMAALGYSITSTTIEVDENLPNFFNAIRL